MEEPAAAVRLQCAARGWRARRDARSLILENARLAAEDVRVLSASMRPIRAVGSSAAICSASF